MLVDTHAHVNFNAFKKDADEVILRSLANKTWLVLVGAEYKTSKRALDYANKYEKGVYAAVGLHPLHLSRSKLQGSDYSFTTKGEDFNYDVYERLAKFSKVVAIGEIGLDYNHLSTDGEAAKFKIKQQQVFISQLKLACSLSLPAIIHCRQAHDDIIFLLKEFRKKHKDIIPPNKPLGVMHCFSGDEDFAWQCFSLGLIISFTGLITFSSQWDDLIRKTSLEKIMLETDCPFMTPEPYRGKRNEPILVKYIAQRIAKIKKISLEKVAEITTENAKKLFKI